MPLLTITVDGESRSFDIPTDKPVFLGRAKECDINLMSPGVSRRHAAIIARGGICGIKDLDSFNGTFVNGVQVTKPATLKDGDVIRISSFSIVFNLKPSEVDKEESSETAESASDTEPKPSTRLRLPRAMTDTTAIRALMGNIKVEKSARREGEDTCVLPMVDSAAETIMDKPGREIEKK